MTEQLREIGRRLSELRDINGLSVQELAAKCGVSGAQLEAYERGESDFSFSLSGSTTIANEGLLSPLVN